MWCLQMQSASPDPAKSEQNGAGGSAKPDYYNEFGKYLEQPVPGAPQPAVPEEKKMPFSGVKPAGLCMADHVHIAYHAA